MKIKCKFDCQAVDCADLIEESKEEVQEMRNEIKAETDTKELFDDLQLLTFTYNHRDELINLYKTKLRELGAVIPEEE